MAARRVRQLRAPGMAPVGRLVRGPTVLGEHLRQRSPLVRSVLRSTDPDPGGRGLGHLQRAAHLLRIGPGCRRPTSLPVRTAGGACCTTIPLPPPPIPAKRRRLSIESSLALARDLRLLAQRPGLARRLPGYAPSFVRFSPLRLAAPDEDGEVGLDIARPGQTLLRVAQEAEEPFVAGISLAEIGDDTEEQRIQEASTGRVRCLRLELPSREGKHLLASHRLG